MPQEPREHDQSATPEQKLERLRNMLKLDPENAALQQRYFDAALSLGQLELAVEQVESRLKSAPGDARALFNLASALLAKRDYRGALSLLARLREGGASDSAIDFNAGLCHYCLGEYEQSRLLLETCCAGGMRTAGALRLLVSSYHHLGMIDEAVRFAGEHSEAANSDGALAGVYALLYLDANDAMRAARWAKIALTLNPQSVEGRVTQATLLTTRMQTDAARRLLDEVLKDAPQTGRAWIGLGALDLLDQNLDRAKEHLARGAGLMPGHVGSWHGLAWAQLMSGDLNAAEANFNRAMELDRNFAETHGGLASIAALRGEKANAEHLIEIATRLDSECLSAKFAEAVLLGRAGNAAQAQKALVDTVTALSAKNGSALSRLLTKVIRR